MSEDLVQIAATDRADSLPDAIRRRLEDLYRELPAVSCGCDRLGQCCELTEEEAADEWATMYPLYPVEYLNIVDYLHQHVDPDARKAFLERTDERPMRCPFLTGEGTCSIHPVRPLACRTYGILSLERVHATRKQYRGTVPDVWLNQFVRNESCAVCTHTELLEPEKLENYAERMASFHYERDLVEMGKSFDGLDEERRAILRGVTGKDRVTRWTWGGFNTIWQTPVSWLKKHLSTILDGSALAE